MKGLEPLPRAVGFSPPRDFGFVTLFKHQLDCVRITARRISDRLGDPYSTNMQFCR